MTTIITRLFESEDSAQSAVNRLVFKGVPERACDVFAGKVDADTLLDAEVDQDAVATYTKGLAAGQALVVVRATYKPLGAAKLTRDILAKRGGIETDGITEDRFVPDGPPRKISILDDHPLILTLPADGMAPRGPITPNFGFRTTKPHKDKRSVYAGGRHMSRSFWPMPLLSTKERKSSVIKGGRFMSQKFWPTPLLSTKPRRRSVIPGGSTPFSRVMGWRTTSL